MTKPEKLGGRSAGGVAGRSGRERDVMRGAHSKRSRTGVNAGCNAPRRASMVANAVTTRPSFVRCPTCRAAVGWEHNPYRPFCSERCRVLDLGNWAAERYRLPAEPVSEDDEPTDGSAE